ncbi:hypothetical protein [Leptolyngbya sp. 'hensonii']|uniref:hypothetical protein n=1 Tax=Leptolyngbya sp. 'hensonii' TaxID=1922337 RepID=UPI000AEE23D2|nr:hypothetical protein [Leptolyngbya sp. 'hensonii']
MHFDVLIKDASGKAALEILMQKIIGTAHTFTIHSYKGIGHIPKGLTCSSDPKKRILLDQLPKLIPGFGYTHTGYGSSYPAALIIICDLDDRCLSIFRKELLDCVDKCTIKPKTQFCLAIEEGEAWYLGDIDAIKAAYPEAKDAVLNSYANDDICGTWEKLADAVFPGGAQSLSKQGWSVVGKEKMAWAENIAPHMDIDRNQSPSFCYFRDKLRSLGAS